jgi:hypothetical protein
VLVVPPFKRSGSGTPAIEREENGKEEIMEKSSVLNLAPDQYLEPEVLYWSPLLSSLINSSLQGRLERPSKSSYQLVSDAPTTNIKLEHQAVESIYTAAFNSV